MILVKIVEVPFKARPVAYALHEKIELELDRLVKEGTMEPVEFSERMAQSEFVGITSKRSIKQLS